MHLVHSHNPPRSDAERPVAGGQEANAAQAFITSFNTNLALAQRDAIQALRAIIAETADDTNDDESNLDDDARRARTTRRQRLSLRLRAATALLRVKPIADPQLATENAPPARSASTSRRPNHSLSEAPGNAPAEAGNKSPEPTPRAAAAPQLNPTVSSALPVRPSAPQLRPTNAPQHRNGKPAPLAPAAHDALTHERP